MITLGATEAVGGQALAKFMKLFSDKYPFSQREFIKPKEMKEQILLVGEDLGVAVCLDGALSRCFANILKMNNYDARDAELRTM